MFSANLKKIWAVAQAERLLTRRLKRYWLFLLVSYAVGIGIFVYYSVLHTLFSSFSASAGLLNPRYLIGSSGLFYLGLFALGIIFLAFDIRARDQREGILEALDTRPLTNVDLLTGRFLGLFLAGWIPLVILCLILDVLGWLLPQLGSPVGSTLEPFSMLGFAIFMAVPALSFTIAFVFFISLLVKQRSLAAVVALGILGGMYWSTLNGIDGFTPYTDFLGSFQTRFPSDILPSISLPYGWLQRMGFLILASALLGMAVALHPRLDKDNRGFTMTVSVVVLLMGLSCLLVTAKARNAESDRIEQWRVIHAEKSRQGAIPDIEAISGHITIDPGRSLSADISLRFRAPDGAALSTALFTLNPGLQIEQITDADGIVLTVSQSDGLLEIDLGAQLNSGESTTLNLRFDGKPSTLFGYLDSTVSAGAVGSNEVLGTDRAIFDEHFIALMPGIHWLPFAGTDLRSTTNDQESVDYFALELDVEVPASWLAAGPDTRQHLNAGQSADTALFRFSPSVDIAEVALIAAEFEQVSTQINGVHFELLLHPEHTRNLKVLAPIWENIRASIENRISLAEDAGLVYPFNSFTLVEVPNNLRGYKGGWKQDTALAPPSMALLRETSFPTARFDFTLRNLNVDSEGYSINVAGPSLERLEDFFVNDFSGGNIFNAAAKSYVSHRMTAVGREAAALDFIVENLANLVISGERSHFSTYSNSGRNGIFGHFYSGLANRGPRQSISRAVIGNTYDTALWNSALNTSLADFDPQDDPEKAINLLTLKGGELAQTIYDTLGVQDTGRILASLLDQYPAGTFGVTDFIAALEAADANLGVMASEVIGSSQLPGFVVDGVELYRLPDGDNGDSRYQVIVAVRNDEPVTGFTRVSWITRGDGNQEYTSSEPITIGPQSAVEYGVVLSQPPANIYLVPYLSLNRSLVEVTGFDASRIPERNLPALVGVRPVEWNDASDRIISDDLDADFSVVGNPPADQLFTSGSDAAVLDHGLPMAVDGAGLPELWSRRQLTSAWGKYRHTFVHVRAGSGEKKAIMSSQLPRSGTWELEMHLPEMIPQARGTWNLAIVSADGRQTLQYDSRTGTEGWNLVGQYQLPAGAVSIEVTDATDAELVLADAFAWSPLLESAEK